MQILDFLTVEYIKGSYIVNRIYNITVNLPRYIVNTVCWLIKSKYRLNFSHWLFNTEIKLNFIPFEFIKKFLLEL
jgi:hypothetical protein